MRIVANPAKEAVNRRKHGLDFSRVAEILAGEMIDYRDDRLLGYEHEGRVRVLGRFGEKVVLFVFEPVETQDGLAGRPISLRKAAPRERRDFERALR